MAGIINKEIDLVKDIYFPAKTQITREEAMRAFQELRKQAKNVPEMSIDEINAEIKAVRIERRAKECRIMQ